MVKRLTVGRVAQLGERGVRNAEVEGSIPFSSTIPYAIPGFSENRDSLAPKEGRVVQCRKPVVGTPSFRIHRPPVAHAGELYPQAAAALHGLLPPIVSQL